MKVVILAGGYGTRISEESKYRPKPMVQIGEMPILWHIMKVYSHYGFNEFVICAGYKQYVIKDWFANYYLHTSDVTFDFADENKVIIHNKKTEAWKVTVVDTGLDTMTGGRIKRIKDYVGNEPFMLTYGDSVGDIDVNKLLDFHRAGGKIGTVSIYNFGQSKGVVEVSGDGSITEFREKSDLDGDLINIGFMVMEPEVFDYIDGDGTNFEKESLKKLAENNQLSGYIHNGFWQCMDTIRERQSLEKLWNSNQAPWKIWE